MRTWTLLGLCTLLAGCPTLTEDRYICYSESGGQVQRCLEFSDFSSGAGGTLLRGSFASFCAASGVGRLEPGTCPVEGRLGACLEEDEDYTVIKWVYETENDTSIDDVNCVSSETRLGPDGEPYDIDPPRDEGSEPICSPEGTADAATITVTNTGIRPMTLYWGQPNCTERQYQVIDPGVAYVQETFVGHLWRVRAGRGDTEARVLLDLTAEDGGSYEAGW